MKTFKTTITFEYQIDDKYYPRWATTEEQKREIETLLFNRMKTPQGISSFLDWLKDIEHSIEVNVE
jgi:hypothetical protein